MLIFSLNVLKLSIQVRMKRLSYLGHRRCASLNGAFWKLHLPLQYNSLQTSIKTWAQFQILFKCGLRCVHNSELVILHQKTVQMRHDMVLSSWMPVGSKGHLALGSARGILCLEWLGTVQHFILYSLICLWDCIWSSKCGAICWCFPVERVSNRPTCLASSSAPFPFYIVVKMFCCCRSCSTWDVQRCH